jgi:hypothetical protein
MSRPELFAHRNGGLAAVHPGETEYATFSTHGMDAFESTSRLEGPGVVLERCGFCHSDSGIHSVQSRLHWMKPVQRSSGKVNDAFADPVVWETNVTIARKRQQPEFDLLQQLWQGARD